MEIKNHFNASKLWTKNYIFMLLSNLFIYLAFYMLTPTLACICQAMWR